MFCNGWLKDAISTCSIGRDLNLQLPDKKDVTQKIPNSSFVVLFANLGGNLGDLYILQNTIEGLRATFPHCAVTIALLPDRQNENFIEFLLKKYDNIKIVPAFSKARYRNFLSSPKRWPPFLARFWLHLKIFRARKSFLAGRFVKADAIFGVGGGHWKGFMTSLNMLALLKVASERCSKVVLLPQSLPRSVPEGIQPLMAPALRNIKSIYMRDPISLRQAKTIGLSDAILLPDTAFLTNRKLTRKKPNKSNPVIAVCLRSDTQGLKEDGFENSFTTVLSGLTEKGCIVKAFTTYAHKDDAMLKMFASSKVIIVDVTNVDETLDAISSADIIISDRLHVLIFATILGIPILPIASLPKIQGYVEYLEYPISLSTFTALSWDRHINTILRDWIRYHQRLVDFSAIAKQTLESSLFRKVTDRP